MVTQTGDNTFVVSIKGNFDDAQSGVKQMLTDANLLKLLDEKNCMFSSANSINMGRLIPQVVYYFYAYTQLCNRGDIEIGEEINFSVPTGNFGNILAGYYAKKMGLPIKKLICASNENKVLFDFINTGTYDKVRDFVITMSPSMDILISSNLERLLYFISGEDSEKTKVLMEELKVNGKYTIDDAMKKELKDFYGGYSSEEETANAITKVYKDTGYVIDTHTAVSYAVYQKYLSETMDKAKTVIVSTASPYKFTIDVMKAIDDKYIGLDDFLLIKKLNELTNIDIPAGIVDLEKRPILHKIKCEKDEMQVQIEKILKIKGNN